MTTKKSTQKLPTIGLLRSVFVTLAIDASKTEYIIELNAIGGVTYMTQRASEMLRDYLRLGNAADLTMAIQLLAVVKQMVGTKPKAVKSVKVKVDPKVDKILNDMKIVGRAGALDSATKVQSIDKPKKI